MTLYPEAYDNEQTLYTVRDDAITHLSSDWSVGDSTMQVEDISLFSLDGGFCTVYVDFDSIPVELKGITFSYRTVEDGQLVGIVPMTPIVVPRPAGSMVVANIMAEHRNALTDSILAMEKSIGHRETTDEETLEHFADLLTHTVKVPRPWFLIQPSSRGFVFTTFRFEDRTYRLQPWQEITWKWEFGDGETSDEQNPSHAYTSPGLYTVKLKVTNNYGTNSIEIKNAIHVLGTAPSPIDIDIDPLNAIANETLVRLHSEKSYANETGNLVREVIWDLGTGLTYPKNNFITAMFEKGGLFPVSAKQITRFRNFSINEGPTINVVERSSVWIPTQERNSKTITLAEFSPIASIWKDHHEAQDLVRLWSNFQGDPYKDEGFLYSGSIHEYLSTFRALYISNKSNITMAIRVIDALTGIWQNKPDRARGFGWISGRINSSSVERTESNKVYVLFGHINPHHPQSSSLATSERYDMNTETWASLTLSDFADTLGDEDVVTDTAEIQTSSFPKRFRSTNYGENIYILASDANDLMSRFIAFNPVTGVWKTLTTPNINGTDIEAKEGDLVSAAQGIYVVNTIDFLANYNPITTTWRRLTGASLWRTSTSGRSLDDHTLVKAASPSKQPDLENDIFYGTNFVESTFGFYDEGSKVVSSLTSRPAGLANAMGVF